MDLATRRAFFLALCTDVRREIRRMQRFERLLIAAAAREDYPLPEQVERMRAELVKARRQHDDRVEELLLMMATPAPPWWVRVWGWWR